MLYRVHIAWLVFELIKEDNIKYNDKTITWSHKEIVAAYTSILPFLLGIVLSVLLWFTDFDYPFGIFKLFLR